MGDTDGIASLLQHLLPLWEGPTFGKVVEFVKVWNAPNESWYCIVLSMYHDIQLEDCETSLEEISKALGKFNLRTEDGTLQPMFHSIQCRVTYHYDYYPKRLPVG